MATWQAVRELLLFHFSVCRHTQQTCVQKGQSSAGSLTCTFWVSECQTCVSLKFYLLQRSGFLVFQFSISQGQTLRFWLVHSRSHGSTPAFALQSPWTTPMPLAWSPHAPCHLIHPSAVLQHVWVTSRTWTLQVSLLNPGELVEWDVNDKAMRYRQLKFDTH